MSKFEIDRELIRELATLLTETGLTEIEVSQADNRLRVVRQPPMASFAAPAAGGVAAPAPAAGAAPPLDPNDSDSYLGHPGAVTSPMVGTAYQQSEPGAPPFVREGDAVRVGQVLLIIEAMKTFNEIKSPRAGTVRRVFVGNGDPVEYGDVLMLIE